MSEGPRVSKRKKIVIGIAAVAVLLIIAAIVVIWRNSPKDIFEASWKGNRRAVVKFLNSGVNVNSLNNVKDIPLHLAKTRAIAELLLLNGSKVDVPNAFGGTPLHMAAVNGRPEVAAVLIANGADVNASDMVGATPLDHAIVGREKKSGDGRHDEVIKLLQSKGGIAREYPGKLK